MNKCYKPCSSKKLFAETIIKFLSPYAFVLIHYDDEKHIKFMKIAIHDKLHKISLNQKHNIIFYTCGLNMLIMLTIVYQVASAIINSSMAFGTFNNKGHRLCYILCH